MPAPLSAYIGVSQTPRPPLARTLATPCGSLQDARAFCSAFFTYYNHEHRSGVVLHTPYSVHIGTASAIKDKRQAVLNALSREPAALHPPPQATEMPAVAWINKPVTTQHPSKEAA